MSNQNENQNFPNFEIITFRLNEVEKNLERDINRIIDKLDVLLEKINSNELEQTAIKTKISKIESEVRELKKSESKHKEELMSVKISIAEKLGWGAAGGSVTSLILFYLKNLGG
jgi:chromosome segregation ATPase